MLINFLEALGAVIFSILFVIVLFLMAIHDIHKGD